MKPSFESWQDITTNIFFMKLIRELKCVFSLQQRKHSSEIYMTITDCCLSNICVNQGSQTQKHLRATFPGKNVPRAADWEKMALRAAFFVENNKKTHF